MSNYPASLDSDSSLYVAHDYITTKLAAAQAIGDTVAVVANPTGWVANMVLSVDVGKTNAEQQLVTAVAGNVLTVTRAFGGTSASAHAANAIVGNNIDAVYQSSAKSAIIAIETALGAGLSNVVTTAAFTSSSPTQSSAFNFTPIVSGAGVSVGGGTLVVGNNAVTFSTVPAGVNGTDTQHYLYVSNGTGTAEACLITGGAGVAGASNGVIIINCAHTHSGSWTIQSASGGIKEASVYLNGVGTIVLPNTPVTLYGTVVLPTAISLQGQGFSKTGTTGATGTVLNTSASPGLVVADGLGSATGQGMGVYSGFKLYGPGSGSGLWLGGDPASVFAPAAWNASYTRYRDISIENFADGITLYGECNFVEFENVVSGTLTRALYIPNTASGGQPIVFKGGLISVPSGNAIVQDYNSFMTMKMIFLGTQISGTISGFQVCIECHGVHFEPNEDGASLVNITSAQQHVVTILGGLLSTHGGTFGHGSAAPYHIRTSGAGIYYVTVRDVIAQCDSTTTVPVFLTHASSLGGNLELSNVTLLAAGTFTSLVSFAPTGGAAPGLILEQPNLAYGVTTAAAATTVFPTLNFPDCGTIALSGATVGGGITAVSGLLRGQTGTLYTVNAQTLAAGATIGNTITLTPNLPYQLYFDGTHVWVK